MVSVEFTWKKFLFSRGNYLVSLLSLSYTYFEDSKLMLLYTGSALMHGTEDKNMYTSFNFGLSKDAKLAGFNDALSRLVKRRLSIGFMKNDYLFTSTERNLFP